MGVPRGVTPTFTFTLDDEDIDLTAVNNVYVSFSGGKGVNYTKSGDSIVVRAKEVDVFLSQEETLKFSGAVEMQINWTYLDGHRGATEIALYTFTKQLLDRVVE